jgi:hypothetical protein
MGQPMMGQPMGQPMMGQPMGQPMAMDPNIQFGYKPIVTITAMGQLKVTIEKLVISGNIMGFERNRETNIPVQSQSLYSVWHDIINSPIIYDQDYFNKIAATFDKQSANIKKDIQTLFYQASYFYNTGTGFSGEIWNRFYKKLNPLFSVYKQTQADENLWYQIVGTVYALFNKNIFC